MKKFFVVLGVAVFAIAFVASDLMAYNSNLSAEWVRMPSKYASQSADAAYYNPAGLASLKKDGTYLSATNQFYIKEYTFEYANLENKADDPTYLFPSAFVVYKQNNWAMFATFTVPAGGGTLTYDGVKVPGVATVNLKASEAWMTFTLGGSFKLNNMVSFGSGLRYYRQTYTIEAELAQYAVAADIGKGYEAERIAAGYAPFISVDVTPMEGLNIALQFQSEVRARGVEEVSKDDVITTGFGPLPISTAFGTLVTLTPKGRADYRPDELPAVIQLGVGYNAMPGLNIQASFKYEFSKEEKAGGVAVEFEDQNNSYTAAIGAEYTVMPGLNVSAGVIYATTSDTEDSNNSLIASANPGLDSYSFGLGASYVAIEGLTIDLGFIKPVYMSDENKNKQELTKTVWGAAFGVTYRM
jgi:long-subunit fatty acid transport protein